MQQLVGDLRQLDQTVPSQRDTDEIRKLIAKANRYVGQVFSQTPLPSKAENVARKGAELRVKTGNEEEVELADSLSALVTKLMSDDPDSAEEEGMMIVGREFTSHESDPHSYLDDSSYGVFA